MSSKLLSLSPDLLRLQEEGYGVQTRGALLIVRDVPYVAQDLSIKRGCLISTLNLAADVTQTPDVHTIYFTGDFPCGADGAPIERLRHSTGPHNLGHGLVTDYSFSNKPNPGTPDYKGTCGFADYHQKIVHYVAIIAGAAAAVSPGVSARTYAAPDADDEDAVFNYLDSATDRAGLGALAALLASENIGIVGLGGSGGYILDLVAKTLVRAVHLYDKDDYLQHNAFRAPGAPSLTTLREIPKKVDYFAGLYSNMHRGIVPHAVDVDATNVDLLDNHTFVFLSMDSGPAKSAIIEHLHARRIPFIDVGMGLELTDGTLGGVLRVTVSTPDKHDHVAAKVSTSVRPEDDIYATNIQVADLNMLNAALAVQKWKKIRGFYRDLTGEHHLTYTTDCNLLTTLDRVEA